MRRFFGLFVLFFLSSSSLLLGDIPLKPTAYVNDFANIMNPATVQELNSRLAAYEKATSIEIAVVTVNSIYDYDFEDIESFSIELAEKWKVGKKGLDNGVIYIIAIQDRQDRLEVGYGLEPYLTDALSSEIINNSNKIDSYKNYQFNEGIVVVVQNIITTLGDVSWSDRETARKEFGKKMETFIVISAILGVLIIIMLWILDVLRRRKLKAEGAHYDEFKRLMVEIKIYIRAYRRAKQNLEKYASRWSENQEFYIKHIKPLSEALAKIEIIYEPIGKLYDRYEQDVIEPDTDLSELNQALMDLDGPGDMDCIFEYLLVFENHIQLCEKIESIEQGLDDLTVLEYENLNDFIEDYINAVEINSRFYMRVLQHSRYNLNELKTIKAEYDKAFVTTKTARILAIRVAYNAEDLQSGRANLWFDQLCGKIEALNSRLSAALLEYQNFINEVSSEAKSYEKLQRFLVSRIKELTTIREDMQTAVQTFLSDHQEIQSLAKAPITYFYSITPDEERLVEEFLKESQKFVDEATRKNNEDRLRKQKAEAKRRRQKEEEVAARRRRNRTSYSGYQSTFGSGGFGGGGFGGGGATGSW